MNIEHIVLSNETAMRTLTEEQRQTLRDSNFYGNFKIGVNDELYVVVFETSLNTYHSMEYYLGLEYERDDRELYANIGDRVLVTYSLDNDRIQSLLDRLGFQY